MFNLLIKAVKPFSDVGFDEYEFPYREFQQDANLPFKSRVPSYIKKRAPHTTRTRRRRRDREESSDSDSAGPRDRSQDDFAGLQDRSQEDSRDNFDPEEERAIVDIAVRGVIRILYTKAIRSGRVLYRRVYSD